MTYCTAQDVSDITGQDYRDYVFYITPRTATPPYAVGETVTGDTSNATAAVTQVGVGYFMAEPANAIVIIGKESVTGVSGTATVDRVDTASTNSYSAVLRLIDETGAVIDHILSKNGVAVPVTVANASADTLEYLKDGQRAGVAAMIERQIYVQDTSNESQRGGTWGQKWETFKRELRSHPELINRASRIKYCFPETDVTSKAQLGG